MEVLSSLSDRMMKCAEMNFGAWSEEYSTLLEKRKTLMNLSNCVPEKLESSQFDVS